MASREEEIRNAIMEEKTGKAPQPGKRPTGILIIGILGILGAILLLLLGIFAVAIGSAAGDILSSLAGGIGAVFGGLFSILGIIIMLLGLVELIGNYWLLKMKRKGFFIVMILYSLGIALMVASLDVGNAVSIIIGILILYYLYSKRKLFT